MNSSFPAPTYKIIIIIIIIIKKRKPHRRHLPQISIPLSPSSSRVISDTRRVRRIIFASSSGITFSGSDAFLLLFHPQFRFLIHFLKLSSSFQLVSPCIVLIEKFDG